MMVLCSNAEDEDCYFIVTVCSSTELIPQQDSASLLAWELLKMLPPTTVRDVDISIWGELPILLLLFLVSKATLIFLSYMAMPSLSLSLSHYLSVPCLLAYPSVLPLQNQGCLIGSVLQRKTCLSVNMDMRCRGGYVRIARACVCV